MLIDVILFDIKGFFLGPIGLPLLLFLIGYIIYRKYKKEPVSKKLVGTIISIFLILLTAFSWIPLILGF